MTYGIVGLRVGYPSSNGAWQNLPIVGGGFSTKLAVHSDGSMLTGIDVCSAYVRTTALNQTWSNLMTASSLPSDYLATPYAIGGTYDICFDPSNSSKLLLFTGIDGRSLTTVLASTDKGQTWAHTGYGNTSDNPNGGTDRLNGQRMAIDPANTSVWYVGNDTGLKITQNNGTSFSAASGVPTGGEICGVAIDPNSGTTGGITNTIWVGVNGSGVYKSTNAGSSFSLVTGSPTSLGHGKLGTDGTYYCSANSNTGGGNITRIVGTTVTTLTTPAGAQSFALDPVNPGRMLIIEPYGGFVQTLSAACNAGTPTMTRNTTPTSLSTDAPWMDISGSMPGWSASDVWWDPLVTTSSTSLLIGSGSKTLTVATGQNIAVGDTLRVTNTGTYTNYMLGTVTAYTSGTGSLTITVGSVSEGTQYLGASTGGSGTFTAWTITKERIWISHGIGVSYIDALHASNANTIVDQSFGIENLSTIMAIWPPGGAPLLTAADKPIWYIGNNPFTATVGQPGHGFSYSNGSPQVIEGNFAAYAQSSPTTIVGSSIQIIAGSSLFAGKSTSGGVVGTAANSGVSSFSNFPTAPGVNGFWAAASSTNYVAFPLGTGTIKYTTDGGSTWNAATGAPAAVPVTGAGVFWTTEPCCADSVNIGTFYTVGNGNTVYKSTTQGASWTAGATVSAPYLVKLKHPTGQAGHLFFTSGVGNTAGSFASLAALAASHPIAQSFYFSSNAGTSFTALSNVSEVIDFGFSAAAPGKSYPSILICGWVGTTYGLWRCDDFNPASLGSETWTNIGTYPQGWYDLPTCVSGNPSRYNQWIIGGHGSSFKIYGNSTTSWP